MSTTCTNRIPDNCDSYTCGAPVVRADRCAACLPEAIEDARRRVAETEARAASARARLRELEPATDHAKRLAEIEADYEHDCRARVSNVRTHMQRGWLLAWLRAASEALTAAGIPDDGRPLAERIGDLGRRLRGAEHDARLLSNMQDRKVHDDHAVSTARHEADILKRATRAAAIAMGVEALPEDAGPETIAAALRRATERTKSVIVDDPAFAATVALANDLPEPQAGGRGISPTEAAARYPDAFAPGCGFHVAGGDVANPAPADRCDWCGTRRDEHARPPLTMIVAIARNGVIGKAGGLPWRIPEDLRHFKRETWGHALIVGRRTAETLPPLDYRRVLVVSRAGSTLADSARIWGVVSSFEAALDAARGVDPHPIVIGGAEVYRAALPFVTRILLTEIDADHEGDVFFRLDRTGWRETERRAGETPGVSFVTLERESAS